VWVHRKDLWFFTKAKRLIKTQNKKEKHAVRQQPISAEAWVHSLVSLVFMVVV